MIRVARFLTSYLRHPAPGVVAEETVVPLGGGEARAHLYRPRRGGRRPGWVVLHGITVPGREHPSLVRFARSLAGSGAVVLVPEIRAWSDLRIDPTRAEAVIAAAAEHLAGRGDVEAGGVGVIGFSFGATQALATAARPELRDAIRSVVAFGGYCDPLRTFEFAFTGEHEWRGRRRHLEPDPYGRWIVTANYLTAVPEYRGMERVAAGARALAAEAGRRGVFAGEAVYDPLKARIAEGLTAEERAVWELVAPMSGAPARREEALALAGRVAACALEIDPALDPRPALARLDRRVVLAHGQDDRLIPVTESLRLRGALARPDRAFLGITRLFAHSREAGGVGIASLPLEGIRYLRLLDRALRPA